MGCGSRYYVDMHGICGKKDETRFGQEGEDNNKERAARWFLRKFHSPSPKPDRTLNTATGTRLAVGRSQERSIR